MSMIESQREALFDSIDAVTTEVLHEVARAKEKFLPFNSAHEGYAVLLEEVDELWDEVKRNQRIRDKALMRKEAIQCAAMAVRFVMDVCDQARADEPPVATVHPTDIPRRHRLDMFIPAERAIWNAQQAVEGMPADVRLTDAVVLLLAARDSVADFVDGIVNRRSVSTTPNGTPASDAVGQPTSDTSGEPTRVPKSPSS